RGQPRLVEGLASEGQHVRLRELPGGDVHAHRHRRPGARPVLPHPRFRARALHHPAAQRYDRADLLGERDELLREEQPPLGVLPADEGFHARDPPRLQRDERLIVEPQLATLERAAKLRAWLASSMSSTRTANSSPPSRATVSPGRRHASSRRARATSTSSPAWWPRLSLTTLNWSTST